MPFTPLPAIVGNAVHSAPPRLTTYSKYYMHGVSHHLGIDVHDVTVDFNKQLRPGAVISDEPGLYIDEWGIGIRIEDDVLITEDGAVCLSEDIIRTTDEIEEYMAQNRVK